MSSSTNMRRLISLMFIAALLSVAFSLPAQVMCDKSQLCPAGGGSSPAYVSGKAAFQSSGVQAIVTISVSAGNGVFVYCQSTAVCTTPTSTGATETFATYTGASGCQNYAGDDVQCWDIENAVGGDTAINCNVGLAAEILCIVGQNTRPQGLATAKDGGGNGFNSASTGFSVATSASTTNANDILWACFGGYGANFTSGIAITGFTMPTAMQNTYGGCGYDIVAATGVQTAVGSWSTSQRATGIVMAFKP